MGWASAGQIFDRVAKGFIDAKAPPEIAAPVLKDLIDVLTDMDWDTVSESREQFLRYPWIEDVFFGADHWQQVCESFAPGSWPKGKIKACEECGWSKRIHKVHPGGLNR